MDEVWTEAQAHVARELGGGEADLIVFSPNTHDFLVRLVTAAPRRSSALRVLTSDGEFHSARRQMMRWEEEGWIEVERVATEPFDDFPERFLTAARHGGHDLILVSQVLFGSGRMFDLVEDLAALGRPDGPWVVIDGYHAFMALLQPLGAQASTSAFYLGGGYKYAMAGEGCAFMHAPPGFAPRPPVTGWFAEFEDLSLPPGASAMPGCAAIPRRDLRSLRALPVQCGAADAPGERSDDCAHFGSRRFAPAAACRVDRRTLRSPPRSCSTRSTARPHARFLAFRSPDAQHWYEGLKANNCITDVRGDVLRIGFGLYHDDFDVERLAGLLGELA